MPPLAGSYLASASALFQKAVAVNAPVLKILGPASGESLARDGVLHRFGNGHSDVITRELAKKSLGRLSRQLA